MSSQHLNAFVTLPLWLLAVLFIAIEVSRKIALMWTGAVLVLVTVFLGCVLYVRKKDPIPSGATDEDVARIARSGDTNRAIRWYQAIHSVRLEDARVAVHALMNATERHHHGGQRT